MKNISIFEGMRFVLKILDFLVVTNVYVATWTFSLTWLSLQFYGNDKLDLAFFVFFSTLFAYNFNKKRHWRWFLFGLLFIQEDRQVLAAGAWLIWY